MWTFFIFSMIGISAAIVLLLRRFCAASVSLPVKLVTAYAWLNCMAVVAIVPIDVYSTLNHTKPNELGYMWMVAFWSTQFLTWLLLPFFQYYSVAGDFSVKNKALRSLKENGILYASVAVVGVIAIVVLLFTKKLDFTTLVGTAAGLSNAFGLIVSILLLGYGLVEIPRNLWKSNPETQLKWCAHRAGKFASKVMRSTSELESVVTIIHANEKQMRRHDPLRQYMDIIYDQVAKESPIKPADLAARGVDIEAVKAEDLEYNYEKKGLADLRGRLIAAIAAYNADRKQYEECIMQAFEYEEVLKARSLQNYTPSTPSRNPLAAPIWYFKCVMRPYWNKAAGAMLAILSLLVVWGECTIVSTTDINPLSLLIKSLGNDEFSVQLFTLVPLAYICASSYTALFSITAFNYNLLVPRATTGEGLMQNGTLMCRFAAPICWNFYHMIRMTSTKKGETTVFTDKMGAMDTPEFLKSHLNTYLPLLLAVECLITIFNLWERLLGCCVSSKYRFTETDDVDDVYTEKGRMLIQKERECVAGGQTIGDVLHAAYFDLEFPDMDLGPRSRAHQQKGFFGRLFGKQAPKPSMTDNLRNTSHTPSTTVTASSSTAPGPKQYKSATAAAAASRWLGQNAVVAPPDTTSKQAALLASRYDKSPHAEDAHASGTALGAGPGAGAAGAGGGGGEGGKGSGLDGIFAGLGGKGGGATGAPRADGKDTDKLLGGMFRSS